MASTLAAGRCTAGASSGKGMQYTIAVVQHSINTCTSEGAEAVFREAARALGLPEPEEYRRSAERPNLLIRIGDPCPGSAAHAGRLMLAGPLDTLPPGDLRSGA